MKEDVFVELYREYSDSLYKYCLFRADSKEMAEDIVAETFTRFFAKEIEEIEQPRAWLFQVARHVLYDEYNRKKIDASLDEGARDTVPKDTMNVEKEVITDELIAAVQSELKTMDSDTADVIALRVWEEMPFKEIAEVVGITAANARKKFERGVAHLVAKMKAKEKQVKLRSISVPALLAGILGVQKAYAGSLSSGFTTNLLSNLAINTSLMTANTTATTAAGAAANSTTAATAASGGIAVGAKVALATVATTVVLGGGAAGFFVLNNDSEDSKDEDEIVEIMDEEKNDIHEGIDGFVLSEGWSYQEISNCNARVAFPSEDTTYEINSNSASWTINANENGINAYVVQEGLGGTDVADAIYNIYCERVDENFDMKSYFAAQNERYQNDDPALPGIELLEELELWGIPVYKTAATTSVVDQTEVSYYFVQENKLFVVELHDPKELSEALSTDLATIFGSLEFVNEEVQTYTSEFINGFSFEYSANKWEVSETVSIERDFELDITLASKEYDSELFFRFFGNNYGDGGGGPVCENTSIQKLSGGEYRVEADGTANNLLKEYFEKYDYTYIHEDKMYLPGSEDFSNAITVFGEKDASFCTSFWFNIKPLREGSSNVLVGDLNYNPYEIDTNQPTGIEGHVYLKADGNNFVESINAADSVINTMQYPELFF